MGLIPTFGLGGIFQITVLLINAIAILSEDRFLARIGWSASSATEPAFGGGAGADLSVKTKIINLMTSIQTLMRIPLIGINTMVILFELALG